MQSGIPWVRLKVVRDQENCGVTFSDVTNSLYAPLRQPIRVLLMSHHCLNDAQHHSRHTLLLLVRRFPIPFRIFHEGHKDRTKTKEVIMFLFIVIIIVCYYSCIPLYLFINWLTLLPGFLLTLLLFSLFPPFLFCSFILFYYLLFFLAAQSLPPALGKEGCRRDVSHSRNSPASVFIIFRASFLIFQHVLAPRNHSLDLSSLLF